MALDLARDDRGFVHLTRLRLFEHAFRSTDLAVVVADLQKQISYLNPAAERLLGWESSELLGRSAAELTAPGHQRIDLDRLQETGESWTGERLSRRKDGSLHPTRTTVSLVREEGGEPLGFLGLLADDQENQRWRARLASLIAIGAGLNTQSDPEALLLRICRDARAFFNVDGAYLTRMDEKTQELVGVVADGFRAESWPGWRIALAEPNWASTAAARERRVIIRRDVTPDGRYREYHEFFQVKSALAAPLLRQDRLLGVLAFTDTQRSDRFGPEDAELARAYVELAAVALEDARLHEAERAKNERLLALAHVSQLLTASLEREVVLEAIAGGAQRLLGVDVVRVWLLDTPEGPLRPAYLHGDTTSPPRQLDFRRSHMGEVIRTGQPWQTPDVARVTFHQPSANLRGLHGCLMVPLIARGRPLGGLTIFSKQVRTFDREDVELAQAFADQAALAVQNAEVLARERQAGRLERLLQRSASLAPRDRHHVEQLLEAAERIIELGTASHARRGGARGDRDGRA